MTRFILAIIPLLYSVFLAIASNANHPASLRVPTWMPFLSDKPIGEDGFYMLTVAWNMGSGGGIVYNGGESTTGIQPLATFLFAAIAWAAQSFGADKWQFLRFALIYCGMTGFAFSWLIGSVASAAWSSDKRRSAAAALAGTALSALSFSLFRHHTYGLETGTYLFCLAYCMRCTQKIICSNGLIGHKQALQLGLALGLTGLARVDFLIPAAALIGTLLARKSIWPREAIMASLAAFLTVGPWLAYVYSITGSPLPSSGGAQMQLVSTSNAGVRVLVAFSSLLECAVPFVPIRGSVHLAALSAAAIILAVVFWGRLRGAWVLQSPDRAWCRNMAAWALSLSTLVVIYPLLFWATHFYSRYLAPLYVLTIPLVATAYAAAAVKAGRIGALLQLASLGALFVGFSFFSLHTGRVGNNHSISAGFIDDVGLRDVKIGAFQSGVLGYFHDNIVNLDGKLSSGALSALLSGRMGDYVDDQNINVMIDWPSYFEANFSSEYLEKWVLLPEQPNNAHSLALFRK